MKKLIIIGAAIALFGCNQKNEFPDYDFNSVSFPKQYPVRTLSLADNEYFDNTLDKQLKFNIAPCLSGVYENKKNITVDYVVDETLAANLVTSAGDTIYALPQKYYTLSPAGTVTIPQGDYRGMIDVQLTDAFLDDSLAVGNHYVVPLRITASTADSVLSGIALSSLSDRRIAEDWTITPRDFTLFCIKFVNKYSGNFLHRGAIYKLDANGAKLDTTIYHEQYVERDQVCKLATTGRSSVALKGYANVVTTNPEISMVFNNEGNCTISNAKGSSVTAASGTGKFVANGDIWGGAQRDAIYLNYTFTLAGVTKQVVDTLVFRDRGIVYEEFTPVVKK